MQTKSHFICGFLNIKLDELIYVSLLFEHLQHISTIPMIILINNRDNFGHYNRDKKFSYHYIPSPATWNLAVK